MREESHLCDLEREERDLYSQALWLQMQQSESATEWSHLREELYRLYEVLSFSFGAKYFGNKRLSPDDIRQCCRIGVVQAIDDWEPERGSLTTMVAYWVSREIRSWCRAEGVYSSSSESQDRDDKAQEACQVRTRRKCDLTYVSFEQFNTNEKHTGVDFTDVVMEQSIPGHEEESVLSVSVDDALSVLDPVRREIVERYYGLKGHPEHTLRDLEPLFNVSYQTIKNRLGAAHREMAPLLEGYA